MQNLSSDIVRQPPKLVNQILLEYAASLGGQVGYDFDPSEVECEALFKIHGTRDSRMAVLALLESTV